jgi:hypothetical protein
MHLRAIAINLMALSLMASVSAFGASGDKADVRGMIRHIVAPGAMGEYGAAAPNETSVGRAQNGRVEVKVLVNKGMARS